MFGSCQAAEDRTSPTPTRCDDENKLADTDDNGRQLHDATITGATFVGATWSGTTCPIANIQRTPCV